MIGKYCGALVMKGGLLRGAMCALVVGMAAGCGDVERAIEVGSVEVGIVDGRPASYDEIYSTVALLDPSDLVFCTGTLVTPVAVLTAAHCVQDEEGVKSPRDVEVVAGLLDASFPSPDDRRAVHRIIPHERYDVETLVHDIALLMLAEPIHELPTAGTVSVADFDENVFPGFLLTIAGYGVEHPDTWFAGLLNIAETPYLGRSKYDFLAGGEGESDTCMGDSGGPVYARGVDGMLVVGITSYGIQHPFIRCGIGGVYTFVPAYVDWINAALNDHEHPTPPAPPPLYPTVPERPPSPEPEPPRPENPGLAPTPPPDISSAAPGCSVGGETPTSGFALLLLVSVLQGWRSRSRKTAAAVTQSDLQRAWPTDERELHARATGEGRRSRRNPHPRRRKDVVVGS